MRMMIGNRAMKTHWMLLWALVALINQATALSNQDATSRRLFLSRAPLVASAVGAGWLLRHDDSCGCPSCVAAGPAPALAYERRDVGGADRSPEQEAYNEQAYKTNNRLERDGFKLDTAEQQSATLTAALSDYSYDVTPSKSSKGKKDDKKKQAKK
jgi:hypothetical protein